MKSNLMPAIYMLALCLVCLAIFFAGFKKALGRSALDQGRQRSVFIRTIIITAAWLALISVLSAAGFFRSFTPPPRIPIIVIIFVITVLIISFRPGFKSILSKVPPHWLVMMQSFRIVVEFWLWYAFTKELIPVQMTFEGRNFDILSGILGLVAAWLIMKKRKGWKAIATVYNIIGIGLLLNIVIVAVLSFPGPTRYFENEPANSIIAEFPFIYLPGVLVVLAFVLHILSLRQVALAEK